MSQQQGSSSTVEGRLGGQIGNPVVAANFALGAGWGTTASVAVGAGSNDQRGTITVTSAGTGQAQATANVTLTFVDGAFAAQPGSVFVVLQNSSNAVNEPQPTNVSTTTTLATWRAGALPVAAATYRYTYAVIA